MKFLLVLDDVWNENYNDWDVLQRPFKDGAHGSRIVATMRSRNAASVMRPVSSHHLGKLSDDDCWLLFTKHAFGNSNPSAYTNLEARSIGRQIVRKCDGLPLAAKALGGLLCSTIEFEEWNKILKSEIWDLPNDSILLPALRLSYHYLSTHLKRCFAYFSIFPKDYKFKKEELVLLWMAEGFVQPPKSGKTMDVVGDEYFYDLLSRSFFQQSCGGKSCFVMHDLINDLAQSISRKFCFRLEGGNQHRVSEKAHHFSYYRGKYDSAKKFGAFNDVKCLRTFLQLEQPFHSNRHYLTNMVTHDLLPMLRCLRVLSLSNYQITMLPNALDNLKQLRYFDLSHTAIRILPDSMSNMFNLQTLILSNCCFLVCLPSDLRKLINLRHLNITETDIKEMPVQMSKLRNLQTLTAFVVGEHSGSSIKELKELQDLQGSLAILNLQNVANAMDAFEANLKNKKNLQELVLKWDGDRDDSQNARSVLEKLVPHTNLKKLVIEYYGGTRFPDWLGESTFSNMVFLRLSNCRYCWSLPPLGQLPSLKRLFLVGIDGVKKVGPEFYGNDSSSIMPFASLETLRFEKMLKWEEWLCCGSYGEQFPHLKELCILECPKLTGHLPNHLPSLVKLSFVKCPQLMSTLPSTASAIRELELSDCENLVVKSDDDSVVLQFIPYLERLLFSSMSQMKELPKGLQNSRSLQHLIIEKCDSLCSLPEGLLFSQVGLPTSLKTLDIYKCGELELWSHGDTMHSCSSVEHLSLWNGCNSLESLPLFCFPMLQTLVVFHCANLERISIPLAFCHRNFTSLNHLQIVACSNLVSFPSRGLPAPNLTFLLVSHCDNLKELPERMYTLTSLKSLTLSGCPRLESFPEGGLPPNLNLLAIRDCSRLTANRMEWNLQGLPYLRVFKIADAREESFPEEWLLPATLSTLKISRVLNLKMLDVKGLQRLTSLEELEIRDCPKLQCIPYEGLPTSLSVLLIWRCPLLMKQSGRDEGKDWPNIAHIPFVNIDGKTIS
ncbi:LOW QUALITY PROTEIN: putative disease resistance protein At3g14460 [Malania oleifera]|uniref:LOW QUALITY PROTEIN: putative disease resistance protein At3g14460 n=1 Tax=Malania oleifera TaxID=397392 RepID=UPI0025AE8F66|nr:LOW QUALITY PROTEIN: putative disease resistance protein At3g14460 [Malania oleifera]